MQLPLAQHVHQVLAADEPRQEHPAGSEVLDGPLEGFLDVLDDELPADDDEVVVVLLEEGLEGVLVGLFDEDVDAVVRVDLEHLGDAGLDAVVFDLPVDGQLLVDALYPVDRDFLDRDQDVGAFFLGLEHPEAIPVDQLAVEGLELVLDLVVDDDGLVDYVDLLVAVGLGGG